MNHRMRLLLLFAVLALFLAGCRKSAQQDRIDWSVSLSKEKTAPYGASIAYESLPDYFPAAHRETLSKAFRYTSIDERLYGRHDSASLLILLGLDFHLRKEEWGSLLRFAAAGNEVFLLSSNLDSRIAKSLELAKVRMNSERQPLSRFNDGSSQQHVLRIVPGDGQSFGYHGRSIDAYFVKSSKPAAKDGEGNADTQESGSEASLNADRFENLIVLPPDSLGTANGNADFLRYRIGKGHITLHAAPLVLSNYFLLQPGNRAYLDAIWHSFPAKVSAVYWNEYFERREGKTRFSVLLQYPATRRALLLAAFALLLYVLFNIRRRQRIVPVLPQPENTSAIFAETVGRLYFNKGNHANLAEKMVQHFLDFVRSRYGLDTSQMNEIFVRQLAAKSGRPEAEVSVLVGQIHELRLGAPVPAEYLYQLYHKLEKFYQPA